MRVLYASERPPYPFFLGGAARSAHLLMARLSAMPQCICSAIGSQDYDLSSWRYPNTAEYSTLDVRAVDESNAVVDCGYLIRLFPDFYNELVEEIGRSHPDVVWSQLEGALPVLRTAQRLGAEGLCYIHDAEFNLAEMREIAALNCHLIASSRFLSEKVYRATGRRPNVIYPPAELYFDTHGDNGGFVTMVNPHPVKGLDTFIKIARRLPGVDFLLQESWPLGAASLASLRERLSGLPNVRFAHRVSDMRGVYRQTRLLIVPSCWEEGFGMVALEAQSCGIPVIASRRGGLPEAVGDGGLLIKDYLNVDSWVEAVEAVIGDARLYRDLARRARRHAFSSDFSSGASARRLFACLQSKPVRQGWLAQQTFRVRRRIRNWPLLGRFI